MGVATPGATGTTGGSNSADLSHDHSGPAHTHGLPSHEHTGAAHTHTVANHAHVISDHQHTMRHVHQEASHTHTGDAHRHQWLDWIAGNSMFATFTASPASEVTYGPTTNTLVNSIGGAAGNVVAAAMSTSAPSRDFFTSGAWNGTNQSPGTTGGSGTLTSTEARPFNDPTGADVTYTGTSTGSLTSSSTALTTDSASAANTGSWSGTTDSDGASNTGSAGSVTFDNRSAWVGLLKIMRIR